MKITIEKVTPLSNSNRSFAEPLETKVLLSIEKLPSMDKAEWNVLKEAIDNVVAVVKKIDVNH